MYLFYFSFVAADPNSSIDLESLINPMFKKMNDSLQDMIIDIYGFKEKEIANFKEKFFQIKIYMWINLWKFYDRCGNINKRLSFIGTQLVIKML